MNTAAAIAEVRQSAQERIETCDMYLKSNALVSHNWAVVSSLWNCRGVFHMTDPDTGNPVMALGPYPNRMPSLYTREDADRLVAHHWPDANGETMSVVDRLTWWQTERDDAVRVLASLEGK